MNSNEIYALTQNGFYQGNLNTKSWNSVVAYQFHGESDFLKLSDNNFLIADVGLNRIIDGNIKVLYVPANFFVEDNNNIFFAGNNFRYIGRNGIFWGEVYKLTDNESNYELLLKLPETISINYMKIDKLDRIYLATTQGLYVSSNQGVEWNKIDDELSNESITSLQVGYDNRLFAITNIGIYKEIEYDTVNTINDEINSFALFQNFPNPFNSSTTIRYQIQQARFVSLKVYDVLGKEAATLVNEEKPAGEYSVTFSAKGGSNLSSGVYFYQLKSGNFVETKKLILMK